jgi:hypothetical protein
MSRLIDALSGENPWINTSYLFHGFAPNQADDTMFRDISGNGNDGAFGADLVAPWANAGYVSTEEPAGGDTDESIRIPAVNLHYDGGESLLVWWLGKITPEGSNVEFMGDGGFSNSYPGWSIRVSTTGKAQLKIGNASAQYFSGASTATAFDGTLKSVGLLINGTAKTASIWVEDALDVSASSLNSGASIDTRTTNTVNIGTSVPASAASTVGIVTQTRACAILKFGVGQPLPTSGQITTAFQALRRNPSRPLLKTAFS